MTYNVHLFMFLLAPAFLAASHKCKIVTLEQMNCITQQKGCDKECKIELIEECRQIQPEDCNTEYETKCTEDNAREKRSINAVLAPTRHLAILHSLGLGRRLAGLAGFGGLGGLGLAKLGGLVPFGGLGVGGLGLGALGLGGLGVIKLAKLKALVAAKKIGLAKASIGGLYYDPKKENEETCFEIPRTVCPYGHTTYTQSNAYHRKRRDASGVGCTTTVQRVCGSNPRKKRSLNEKMGCNKVPVSQFCIKQQEVETRCDLINKEICVPSKNCKEIEVCSPERIQKEVCEDEDESDEADSEEYGDL